MGYNYHLKKIIRCEKQFEFSVNSSHHGKKLNSLAATHSYHLWFTIEMSGMII